MTALRLARFDEFGRSLGAPATIDSDVDLEVSAPSVVALPDGAYAVAWTGTGEGGLDVFVRRVQTDGSLGARKMVNVATVGAQHAPDLVRVGNDVLVAWSDTFGIRARWFAPSLKPLSVEEVLDGGRPADGVALAQFGEGWAAAWRAADEGGEVLAVVAGDKSWTVGPFAPGASNDRPAITALDSSHLFVVFTEGTDPEVTGTNSVSRLRGVLIETKSKSPPEPFPLPQLLEPYGSDLTLAQRRPALEVVGSRIYLAWEADAPQGDERGREPWLQQIHFSGNDPSELLFDAEAPIGVSGPWQGDQTRPALAGVPVWPEGALIAAWEDSRSLPQGTSTLDVRLVVRPLPFLTLPPESE